MSELKPVTIYCDGASIPNPGEGGWACVLINGIHALAAYGYVPTIVEVENEEDRALLYQGKTRKPICKNGKHFIQTTNNRMEMLAIIKALELLKKPAECEVSLHCDSQVALYGMSGEWRARENLDLVAKGKRLIKLCGAFNPVWVKGHSGIEMNERCDGLALKAITEQPPLTMFSRWDLNGAEP